MDFKLIGSVLLVVGTSIGAGMLALPIALAQLGFFGSIIMLVACWAIMTIGALYLLEANLWGPQNSNIITMAKMTLGPLGQIVAWITYLLLLYSLLCAYIAGGNDLFRNLLTMNNVQIPEWLSVLSFTLIFGTIVFLGIRAVDYANRGLMAVKLGSYLILVFMLIPFISLDKLKGGSLTYLTSATAITVSITSFGYATIVPSLRVYFAGDIAKLKRAILIGSLIPLVCYIFWDLAIMGILPIEGTKGLVAILNSDNSTSDLVNNLNAIVQRDAITFFVKVFTSICVLTSFLGVSLCLADFLADGLQLEKKGGQNFIIHLCAFIPPMLIVLYYPNAFISALQYAGIYCLILLVLLPVCMVWRGRYKKHISRGFRVIGGKPLLIALGLLSLSLIVQGFI